MAAAFAAMQVRPDATLPGGSDDQRREAMFRRDPSRYLPGAMTAAVAISPPGIGFVYLNGKLTPWTYGTQAYAGSDVDDVAEYMEHAGLEQGLVVGAPSVGRHLRMREGVRFVAVPFADERAA